MNLSRKTFIYTLSLAALIIVFIVLYLIIFLPSLYVEYSYERQANLLTQRHMEFLENNEYDSDNAKANSSVFTTTISIDEKDLDKIYYYNLNFSGVLELKDERLKEIVAKITPNLKKIAKAEDVSTWDELENINIQDFIDESETKLFKINSFKFQPLNIDKDSTQYNFVRLSNDTSLNSARTKIDGNDYANNLVVTYRNNKIIVTAYSAVAGSIDEIVPIILMNIPVIIAVILVIIILSTLWFSNRIVKPIEKITSHTNEMINMPLDKAGSIMPLPLKTNDEFEILANDIDELYLRLSEQYERLKQDMKSREVFLQASSHQLKTPITVSLLLIEGMIGDIGKYKDHSIYLPKVKNELINMRFIIDELLDMNEDLLSVDISNKEEIDMRALVENLIDRWFSVIDKRELHIEFSGNASITSNLNYIQKITENIIENAIKYAQEGSTILIELDSHKLELQNKTEVANEEIFNHIFEPFVSSGSSGNGLGLYFSNYYAKIMGYSLDVFLEDNIVTSRINFS